MISDIPKFGGTDGAEGIAPLLPVPPALHLQHAWPLTAEMAISHACMALLHIICIIYRTGKRSKIIFLLGKEEDSSNPNHLLVGQ